MSWEPADQSQHIWNAGEWGGFAAQGSPDFQWHAALCQYLQKVSSAYHRKVTVEMSSAVPVLNNLHQVLEASRIRLDMGSIADRLWQLFRAIGWRCLSYHRMQECCSHITMMNVARSITTRSHGLSRRTLRFCVCCRLDAPTSSTGRCAPPQVETPRMADLFMEHTIFSPLATAFL